MDRVTESRSTLGTRGQHLSATTDKTHSLIGLLSYSTLSSALSTLPSLVPMSYPTVCPAKACLSTLYLSYPVVSYVSTS